MKITNLEYFKDPKNNRLGFVDFKSEYADGRWEVFRSVAVFRKDDKMWLSVGAVQRGEKWLQKYERPNLRDLFAAVIEELKKRDDELR